MEETQRVALHKLAEVHQATSLSAVGGILTAMMASPALADASKWLTGTDAADARGDAGHLAERTAFAKFLETAELDDVELGVGDVAGVVEKG